MHKPVLLSFLCTFHFLFPSISALLRNKNVLYFLASDLFACSSTGFAAASGMHRASTDDPGHKLICSVL
jgi:hypothetical protein